MHVPVNQWGGSGMYGKAYAFKNVNSRVYVKDLVFEYI